MSRLVCLLALGLVGIAAVGCTSPVENGPAQAVDVEAAFPIVVEPQVATLVIQVDEGLQNIARGEEDRVRAFVTRWKTRGQGMLNAAAPTGTANQAAAMAALDGLKRVLAASGAPKESVQFSSYRPAGSDANAPITLSFVTYAATAPDCGQDWSKNLGYSPRNTPWPEFGCSTQHNLAAIVADPRDLVEPHASDPADAERRSTVIEKYRAGEPTRTMDDSKADSGQVSTVGQ